MSCNGGLVVGEIPLSFGGPRFDSFFHLKMKMERFICLSALKAAALGLNLWDAKIA